MHIWLRVTMLALLVGCVLLLIQAKPELAAQTGDAKKQGDVKEQIPKKIPLDQFKMPPGGVAVLVEESKGVPGYFPSMVLMTPAQHQELMDRLAALENNVKAERKTPHTCKLTATVEGETLRLQADLYLHTEQPRATVLIGFRGAQLSEAKIHEGEGDGEDAGWQQAVVDLSADGYSVQVEKAGNYQVRVLLKSSLANPAGGRPAPGSEHSFELALPGAAVTTMTLDLPGAVKELRWNKNVEKPAAGFMDSKHWQLAVGKITLLQVSWKEPLLLGGKGQLRTVHGQVSVRIEEDQVATTALLTLTDLRGKEKEWRLWLPEKAKLAVVAPEGLPHSIGQVGPLQQILKLSVATTEPIKVAVTLTGPSHENARILVGPFAVEDASLRQEGTIEIKMPQDVRRRLRLSYRLSGSIEEREPPRDQPGSDVIAVFKYGDMPTPPRDANAAVAAKVLVPPLEIERRPIRSKVETRVEHHLQLQQGQQGWQIVARCKITAKPLDAPVDYLDVQLPGLPWEALPFFVEPRAAGFPGAVPWGAWWLASQVPIDGEWILANPSATVELQYADAAARDQRRIRIKWSQPQSKEVAVTLEGRYAVPAGLQKIHLELPRPVAFIDRGAKGKMEVGPTLELLTQEGGPEMPVPQKHTISRDWERAPLTWDLAWRPSRPEFPVTVTTDMKFRPERVHVTQRIAWNPADWPAGTPTQPALLCLRVPSDAKDLRVAGIDRGDRLVKDKQVPDRAWIEVADRGAKGWTKVEYDFALPAASNPAAPFGVPLLWPEQATQVDTKLRLWSQPEVCPILAEGSPFDGPWKDAGTEVVAGEDRLPALVLVGLGQDLPLSLRLKPAAATLANIVIDRLLVLVDADDDGTAHYHARFLLTKVHTANLEVRMPLPMARIAPKFLLDGKAIYWQPKEKTGGLVARLGVEPSLCDKPEVILEVIYQMPAGQSESDSWWRTTLNPPVLEGNVFLGKVRWQVTLPPSRLTLGAGGNAGSQHSLRWRGWLPSLEAAITPNDLEQWHVGQELAGPAGEASLVSIGNSLEPLQVIQVPRALWFLTCSGLVLLIGLALWFFPLPPGGWAVLVVVVLSSLTAVAWLWAATLPALLYGASPGLAVLAVLLPLQWLVQERYRRQLVFMPGFTRVKAGSSLLRSSSVLRGHEPSTIDAPLALERSNLGEKPKDIT